MFSKFTSKYNVLLLIVTIYQTLADFSIDLLGYIVK
jgi:hypothetical protein